MIILFLLFAISLIVSLAAAQFFGAVIILCGIVALARGNRVHSRLWMITGGYVALLAGLDFFKNGPIGIWHAVENTWPVFLVPSVATLASDALWPRIKNVMVYGFTISAVIVIVQFFFGIEGRYGFHSSPYVATLLLIPVSFILIPEKPMRGFSLFCWIVIAMAIVVLNTRVLILAWLAGLVFYSRFRFRLSVVAAVVIVAVVVVSSPVRWSLNYKSQTSLIHRLSIWSQVIDQISEKPIFGHGFEKFLADPNKAAPEYIYYLQNQPNPHSGYLMILHASGIVGYFLLWTFYGSLLYLCLSRNRVAAANFVVIMIAALMDKTFFMTLPSLEHWFLVGWAFVSSKRPESGPFQ